MFCGGEGKNEELSVLLFGAREAVERQDLLMDVGSEVEGILASDLDVGYMEGVDDGLDLVDRASWGGREGKDAEVVIGGLDESYDLRVGVVPRGSMCLIFVT